MIKKSLYKQKAKVLLGFIMLFILCNLLIFCSKQIEILEGVDRQMASYRSQNISNVNYKLKFYIPKNKEEKVCGEEIITFSRSEERRVGKECRSVEVFLLEWEKRSSDRLWRIP